MILERIMVSCRQPVQGALDGLYVRTGVPFYVLAPWAYGAAIAAFLFDGAFILDLLLRSPFVSQPFSFVAPVGVPLMSMVVLAYLGWRAMAFSAAAARDPWLTADATYRVFPSVEWISALFVVLLAFVLYPIPTLVRVGIAAVAHPVDPAGAPWFASILVSMLARAVAMTAILVAGCERCRKARRPSKGAAETRPLGATTET